MKMQTNSRSAGREARGAIREASNSAAPNQSEHFCMNTLNGSLNKLRMANFKLRVAHLKFEIQNLKFVIVALALLFACAETPAQTIQLISAPGKFYVDDKSGNGILYNYAAYTVSNNTAVTLPRVYVCLP